MYGQVARIQGAPGLPGLALIGGYQQAAGGGVPAVDAPVRNAEGVEVDLTAEGDDVPGLPGVGAADEP